MKHKSNIFFNRFFTFLFLLNVLMFTGKAQSVKTINYIYTDYNPGLKIDKAKGSLSNSSIHFISQYLKTLHFNNGYLAFSIDSFKNQNTTLTLYMHCGLAYHLKKTVVENAMFHDLSETYLIPKSITPQTINLLDQNILNQVINMGYSYAHLEKEYTFNNQMATVIYSVIPEQMVKFDSIKSMVPDQISYHYLARQTGIVANKPYSPATVQKIKKRINQSGLFLLDSACTYLSENKAFVKVRLKHIYQNSFTGMVGLQPGTQNKTMVTGNITLSLNNIFKQNENIEFDWQKPGNQSQQLETRLKIPFLYKLPVGILFYGNLDKQDTTFSNTDMRIGFSMPMAGAGEITLNGKWSGSSISQNISAGLISSKSNLYGLGYSFSLMDNPLMPRKGWSADLQLFSGNFIQSNTENQTSKTNMYESISTFSFAIPILNNTLFIGNHSGMMINDSLKINNLYRLGGIKSIRGFNERSVYTKSYSYINMEFRYFIGSSSYVFPFYDAGFFNEPKNEIYVNTFRQALGFGTSIETKAGILSVSYAIGKKGTDKWLLNEGKIHIGYINHF